MPLENWIQHGRLDQFLYDWQTGLMRANSSLGLIAPRIMLINAAKLIRQQCCPYSRSAWITRPSWARHDRPGRDVGVDRADDERPGGDDDERRARRPEKNSAL